MVLSWRKTGHCSTIVFPHRDEHNRSLHTAECQHNSLAGGRDTHETTTTTAIHTQKSVMKPSSTLTEGNNSHSHAHTVHSFNEHSSGDDKQTQDEANVKPCYNLRRGGGDLHEHANTLTQTAYKSDLTT